MNILITTSQGGIAGSTFSISYLADGLLQYNHSVHVACKREMPLAAMVMGSGKINHHDVSFKRYFHWKDIRQLAQIVKACRIDIINAQSGIDRNACILAKWIFRLRVRIVFTRRQRPRDEPWIKRWFHLRGADSIVVISDELKQLFIKKGYSGNRLKVIYNGVPSGLQDAVDPKKVEELRGVLKLRSTDKVIGCLARYKDQVQLIEALQYLDNSYTVLFVGIEQHQVQAAINTFNPEQRLIFTGRIPHAEAIHFFPLMQVKVLPSGMDGFGMALVEAMLMKIPVIGTSFGGIKNVIEHGKSGFLFEAGAVDELASCIERICTDQDLRAQFIRNGYSNAIRKFSIERTVQKYHQLFNELLADE